MRREQLDLVFTLLVVALISWTTWEARAWPERARLFPWVVGFPILVLLLILLVRQVRAVLATQGVAHVTETAGIERSVATRRMLGIAGWMIGFAMVIWAVGFGAGGTLMTLIYLKAAAREKWPISLAITAGTAAFFWLLITMLRVPFPRGVIGDLLPF